MSSGTGIVECCEDAGRSLFFNEVAHNFVVEELDRCPLDLFSVILFLLPLQSQLDEDLLQLLIDVVDAELLERVVLEDLETEDILARNLS